MISETFAPIPASLSRQQRRAAARAQQKRDDQALRQQPRVQYRVPRATRRRLCAQQAALPRTSDGNLIRRRYCWRDAALRTPNHAARLLTVAGLQRA